jgi:hypothetical protein
MEPRAAQPTEGRDVYRDIPPRQPFHNANSSLGVVAHVIKTAGILAPLIIGEVVKDADARWRYIRIASVATALLSEGLYTSRIQQERKSRDQQRGCER